MAIIRHRNIFRIVVLQAILLLAACSSDFSDLEQYVTSTRTKYQGSVEPLPQFEPYQNYVYSTFNYRTPFTEPSSAEPEEQTGDTGPRPDKERRKEPLEFFPLDSLTMVGTLERGGETWGLVRDPDGTIHRVQPGNHIGENFGEIIRISESTVDLLEIIPDGLGAWIEREISLSLGEK
ncbi:MAG: pilus assembly protein PilP [Gammaproteobacteria bacterium]|nr:pilus assembly protein PilP [Gammaproteobacteria bacterium]